MTDTNAQGLTALTTSIPGLPIPGTSRRGARPPHRAEHLALTWFAKMRTGQIDRTELAPEYSAHLTDAAVKGMSDYLRRYEFGHLPLHAELIKTRESGNQTFHVVKIAFPRGDAASLLFGLNTEGKVTGISLLAMAGD
jgi:hypothetical protein